MGENSAIEWTDHTWNPVSGCTKVSPGCANCYAATLSARGMTNTKGERTLGEWGPGKPRKRTSKSYWRDPIRWNKKAEGELVAWRGRAIAWEQQDCPAGLTSGVTHMLEEGSRGAYCFRCGDAFKEPKPRRPRVFCASLADWLDPEWPDEVLADLLVLIRLTPNLDWLLLTKRPHLWRQRLEAVRTWWGEFYGSVEKARENHSGFYALAWIDRWLYGKTPPSNVWIGASVENQEWAGKRWPHHRAIPARVRFWSAEPLLGELELPDDAKGRLHWVIAGGESGRGEGIRPMHPDWARSLRDQCVSAGVAFVFKQWGAWIPICELGESDDLYESRKRGSSVEQQAAFDEIYGKRCKVPTAVLNVSGDLMQITDDRCFLQGTACYQVFRVGKKKAGRELDGRTWDEVPS